MIHRFKGLPLRAEGYRGSLLSSDCPYLWARCDWCGAEEILDDEGETDREAALKFSRLLNWCASMQGESVFGTFCSRKCQDKHEHYWGER